MPSPSILAQLEEEDSAGERSHLELAGQTPDPEWYESSADQEKREHPVFVTMDLHRLTTFAYTVAGAATGPLLVDNPNYIFPSERVSKRVKEVMADFGLVPSH